MFLGVFCEIIEEDDVWVLDESNFKEALSIQPELLVEFYAPWCGYCKKFAPEYSKAGKRLKASAGSIHIAKIDGSTSKNLTEKYDITSYPTIKYFVGSKPLDYTGKKTEDSIVTWVLKKTGNTLSIITNSTMLSDKISKTKASAVLFAELNSKEHSLFSIVSKSVDDISFFLCNDLESSSFHRVKFPGIVVFKQNDDKRVDYNGFFSTQEIIKFIEKHKRPLIELYDENLDELIFEFNKPCLLVLRHESQAKVFEKILKKISRQLDGKIIVSYLDISTEDNRKLLKNFGLTGKRQPSALILDPLNDKRYFLDQNITETGLKQFLKDWKNKKLPPLLKSEEIPLKSYTNHVRILVGKDFEDVVYDNNKDVLVEFYAPWCNHCKEFANKYEKLAKELRHIESLIIAKIDATANEAKGLKIQAYPTIKFFPANNKKGIDYNGGLETFDLLEFIKSKSFYKFKVNNDL
jgi:protein disulfide-isomerase A1